MTVSLALALAHTRVQMILQIYMYVAYMYTSSVTDVVLS